MSIRLAALLGLLGMPAQDPKPVVVDAGALKCEVYISRTAHLFHVVDQLAEWSPYCHRQYGRHFAGVDGTGLTEADRAMLAKHTSIRSVRGWGGGLEQTFYSPLDVDAAIKAGIEAGHLTAEQGKIEAEVFAHFAPRIDRLLAAERERVGSTAARIKEQQARLEKFVGNVARFFDGARVTVPVYLIANPSDFDLGGGYNGGRLTLEIPRKSDAFPTLLHEVFHAFLQPRMKELEKAAAGVEALDAQTLNEGLAYAISPGLFHAGGSKDPLRDRVLADQEAGKSLKDDYVRFNRFGLALRPLLRDALEKEGETFERLLPRAVDAWRVMAELSASSGKSAWADHDYRSDPRPCVFIFGSDSRIVYDRFVSLGGRHIFCRTHAAADYDEMFKNHNKPGDLVVLVVNLAGGERIPESYRDLLPKPWKEIEAALRKGETFEVESEARKMRTLLLAAPDFEGLKRLMNATKLVR